MNDEQKKKLAEAKSKLAPPDMRLGIFDNSQFTAIHEKLSETQETIVKILDTNPNEKNDEQLIKLNDSLVKLLSKLERNGKAIERSMDINDNVQKKSAQETVKAIEKLVEAIPTQISTPEGLATDESVNKTLTVLKKIDKGLLDLIKATPSSQKAEDFLPFRRVLRRGNRLEFDDTEWNGARGGGGGSGGGASVQDSLILESTDTPGQYGVVVLGPDGSSVSGGAGGGSGTEYTEDAASAANPAGPMSMARRKDTLSASEVSADGDNIALNSTSKGELYVKQTDAVPVTDNGSTLSVDDGGASITIDGSVGITGALPAGTNAIGKLSANDGVDIGDVTINNTSIPVTDNGGSLTVDAPVTTPAFVRLSDGSSAISTLPVSLASVPSHAVTNAGTFTVQDSEKLADDAAFTVGTTKVNPIGYLADESSTDSVDEGDIGVARMTLDRKVQVVAEQDSNSMRAAGVAVVPKFAAIAASSSGNNTIVAAVNPKKIRVLAIQLISNGTVNAKWQSGASGTDITGLAYLVANTGYVLPYNPVGWFETASNTLLNLNLSAAIAVGGSITYIEV